MPLAREVRRFIGLASATLAAALPFSWASAATTTATFTVTAIVTTNCTITANNLNFGSYGGTVVNGTTTLTAECSTGTPYTIGLNAGTSSGATVTARHMASTGTDLLAYGLFQDATHSTNWGNTPHTDTESGTGNGAPQTFTVFGQIPAAQFVQAGSYSDTITATLSF